MEKKTIFILLVLCLTTWNSAFAQGDQSNDNNLSDKESYNKIKGDEKQNILVLINEQILSYAHFTFELYKDSKLTEVLEVPINKISVAELDASNLRKLGKADSVSLILHPYSFSEEAYKLRLPLNADTIEYMVIKIFHKNKRWRRKGKILYEVFAYYRNSGMMNGFFMGPYFKTKKMFY